MILYFYQTDKLTFLRPKQEISLQVTDSDGTTTESVLAFLVIPENDPPVLGSTTATYDSSRRTHDQISDTVQSVATLTLREDQDTAVPGLSVRDVDLDVTEAYTFGGDPGPVDGGLLEVIISASNGTTSLRAGTTGVLFLVGDGSDDRVLAFRASLAGANRALAGLMYRGQRDFYGSDVLVVMVDDGGEYGWGVLCPAGVSYDVDITREFSRCPQVNFARIPPARSDIPNLGRFRKL